MEDQTESLEAKKQRIMEDLSYIEDPHDRLGYIIDLGKHAALLDDRFKVDTYRIEGCVSNLWLVPSILEGKCHYEADSDALITKGFATLLCKLYSGHAPEEVVTVDPGFLAEVGITQHLSPNRRNGLSQVGDRILSFAKFNQKT